MKKKRLTDSSMHIRMVKEYNHNNKVTEVKFVAPKGFNPSLRSLSKAEVLANRPKDAAFIFA